MGELMPISMAFDYSPGFFDDAHYDLKMAAQILFQRDDVLLCNGFNNRIG